jgi:hypothetical protein
MTARTVIVGIKHVRLLILVVMEPLANLYQMQNVAPLIYVALLRVKLLARQQTNYVASLLILRVMKLNIVMGLAQHVLWILLKLPEVHVRMI